MELVHVMNPWRHMVRLPPWFVDVRIARDNRFRYIDFSITYDSANWGFSPVVIVYLVFLMLGTLLQYTWARDGEF